MKMEEFKISSYHILYFRASFLSNYTINGKRIKSIMLSILNKKFPSLLRQLLGKISVLVREIG